MSLKEDALNQSAQFLFNNGQSFKIILCDGTWSETTGTKQEIFSSEIPFVRPDITYQSALYELATNSVTVLLQNNAYVASANITFNRIALVSGVRAQGSFPILGISGNVVTLDGTPSDWQNGDTVYTSSGTFTITNISGNQITLDAAPSGTVLVNGQGDLVAASEINSKTFSTGTTNQLEYEVVISGN